MELGTAELAGIQVGCQGLGSVRGAFHPVHPEFSRITLDSPLLFVFDVRLVTRLQ
ncbi:MAG TPA: hypothetical protein VH351_05860 [Bryobacteraceae bacterium]|jgi:hypothetical protein|nr:hypothetical protein [Bryobacteraceae bacterium]